MSLRITRAINAMHRRWSDLDYSRGVNHIVKQHYKVIDDVAILHGLTEDEKRTVIQKALKIEGIEECQQR